ncbi:unnamed protein product [Musa acuminata var. zebrina]
MTSIKGDERSKDGTKQGGMGGRDRQSERERERENSEEEEERKKPPPFPFSPSIFFFYSSLGGEREREEFLVTLFLLVFTAKDWPFLRSPSLLACAFTPQTNEE